MEVFVQVILQGGAKQAKVQRCRNGDSGVVQVQSTCRGADM